MSSRTSIMFVVIVIAVLVASGAVLGTAVAQKASALKPQDNLALGEGEVKKVGSPHGYQQRWQGL